MTRALSIVALCLLACEARRGDAVPAAPAQSTPPASEPALARECVTDSDCDADAPRCLGFDEKPSVAPNIHDAVVMHCTRACDERPCPGGYVCARAPRIRSALGGRIEMESSRWCARATRVAATPLAQLPRHVVIRYFAAGDFSLAPVVALYREEGALVVAGPGSVETFSARDETAARAAFLRRGAEVAAWTEPWPASVPRGPNAPGAIQPGARKTLQTLVKERALREVSTPERVTREGAVLVWAPTRRELGLYAQEKRSWMLLDPRSVERNLDAALRAFFGGP